jgi:tRNA threonylcarbamoyladenosine biosynthesis protein TsaB
VLLGIDTSAGLSVAVSADAVSGGRSAERFEARPTVHAEQLSGLIEATCADAGITVRELTGVVVGTGPAPFTGLRVGLMTARTLADALGIEVRGVCSLDVLALQVLADRSRPHAGSDFAVVTDARRREVYWARYSGSTGARIDGPDVGRPDVVAALLGPDVDVFGPGTGLYPGAFTAVRAPAAVSAAAMVRGVRNGLESTEPEPRYLRRPDVS